MTFDSTFNVGNIIALCAMAVSIIFGVISICKSKKAKESEEKAKAFAKNADEHNVAAKKYYDKMVDVLNESIKMDLIYENRTINSKAEAILISNQSSVAITIIEFGVFLNEQKIDTGKLGIKIKELPLSILSESTRKIASVEIRNDHIQDEDIYYLLGHCLWGKENPYPRDEDNPKVYLYAKDTKGQEHKNFIGMRKDIIKRYDTQE